MIFGGTRLGNGARVEEHAIVGRPEQGYAVGHVYPGTGADTVIENGAIIRAGAVIYAGTEIGENTVTCALSSRSPSASTRQPALPSMPQTASRSASTSGRGFQPSRFTRRWGLSGHTG